MRADAPRAAQRFSIEGVNRFPKKCANAFRVTALENFSTARELTPLARRKSTHATAPRTEVDRRAVGPRSAGRGIRGHQERARPRPFEATTIRPRLPGIVHAYVLEEDQVRKHPQMAKRSAVFAEYQIGRILKVQTTVARCHSPRVTNPLAWPDCLPVKTPIRFRRIASGN